MSKDLINLYSDIIQRLYDRQDEFFFTDSLDRDGIFTRIRALRRRTKTFKNILPNDETLMKQIDKAIRVIDITLSYEWLYETNIVPLKKMKEQLESLKIMVTLN